MTMTDQDLTAAERVALHRRTRAATAEQVAAASAIRRATADPSTADVAADILALHYVAAATAEQRPDVATALALVAREQQGRTAHTSRTAERAAATAAESAGYYVPRETLAESAARLVRQRWGKRAASVTATALAADHDAVTAYVAEHFADVAEDKRPVRLAARTLYIGHRLAAARVKDHRHVAAFVAALLADAPTLTADHDAATCTNPKCYRCTAALNPQGKRASTAPVRDIGQTGPLTAPRQGKREGYRRTATAPKERTTPRAIHLLRESSAWAALDLARSHSATGGGGGGESEAPPRETSPLVVAALLALTSADGRGERAHVAERAAGLPRVATEQGKRAARATALATATAEQGRWCAWWATRATSTAERAATAAEQVKCERATAEHRRTATRAAAAAALAAAEGRLTLDPSKLTAAATAVAVHAVGTPALRRAARHYWSTELAAALAACETAERATSSKRAAAYRTWAADRVKRAATARAALAALALAEQRAATALATEQRAAAAALASSWGIAATFAHVRGPAAATATAAALRPPLVLDHLRAIDQRDTAVSALATAERAAARALAALAAHQDRRRSH